jgi:hypothetical protein
MKLSKLNFLSRRETAIPFLCIFIYFASSLIPRISPSSISQETRFYYMLSIPAVLILVTVAGIASLIIKGYSKHTGRSANKIGIAGFSLFSSTCILMPLILLIHIIIPRPLPSGSELRKFNSAIWQANDSNEWKERLSTRQQMLKDVVENILPGKHKAEIEKLLGPSLETNYFRSVDKDLIYYLGPQRDGFLNIDSEWLFVWFDEKGVFERYKIAND